MAGKAIDMAAGFAMKKGKEFAKEGLKMAAEMKRHYDNYLSEVDRALKGVAGSPVGENDGPIFRDIVKGVCLASEIYDFEKMLKTLSASTRVAVLSIEEKFMNEMPSMPDVLAIFDPNDEKQSVWVVCRGTQTIQDISGDLMWLADIRPFANIHVPWIAQERAERSIQALHHFLADLRNEFGQSGHGPRRVAFCGHSLGGAVAGTMALSYLIQTGHKQLDFICITLAAPHYLPNSFCQGQRLPSKIDNADLKIFTDRLHNVVQRLDLVPRMVGPQRLPKVLYDAMLKVNVDIDKQLFARFPCPREHFQIVGSNYLLNPSHDKRKQTIFLRVNDAVQMLGVFPSDLMYFTLTLAQDHNSDSSKDALRSMCHDNRGNFQLQPINGDASHLPWMDVYLYRPGSRGTVMPSRNPPPSVIKVQLQQKMVQQLAATQTRVGGKDAIIQKKAGTVDSDDLLIFSASCCSIQSLYCKFPECCGCTWMNVCCCFKVKKKR